MKKISLNKETVRKLDDRDLIQANGGVHPTCQLGQTVPATIVTCTRLDCFTERACKNTRNGCTTFILC